ncbi:hypothetical protein CWE13_11215 [Aliidiomarina shirensis]|uniref:Uncharacterized protein n=1 Tax=Aliidiomarina shirensis TaxID=1048642 RepID=A0A432WNW2_9GAMM|nr:hypothetical protein CWE13_11215 [Aliidiomarina shirensis]
MNRIIFFVVSLVTFISVGYLSLIFFDMSGVIFKKWGHWDLVSLKISTICMVIALIVGSLFASAFIKINLRKLIFRINVVLLLIWIAFLSLGGVGIIW